MSTAVLQLSPLDRLQHWGPVLLRLFFGVTLILGTQDNVFHGERMLEFRDFLAISGFPLPLFSAYLSAYAQFVAGILIIVGLLTRWAALVMVINFVVALLMVHLALPFSENISPLAMLFCAMFFLLYGPGQLSLDGRFGSQNAAERRLG
jgi:putative oxidoreductase